MSIPPQALELSCQKRSQWSVCESHQDPGEPSQMVMCVFSPLCSVNMLEPMMRVSFRLLGCLRVCRTVDPAGITLSLVCWAPIALSAGDYRTMPLHPRSPPTRLCARDPAALSGSCLWSPSPRGGHFTSGTRRAPATGPTSSSIVVVVVVAAVVHA